MNKNRRFAMIRLLNSPDRRKRKRAKRILNLNRKKIINNLKQTMTATARASSDAAKSFKSFHSNPCIVAMNYYTGIDNSDKAS